MTLSVEERREFEARDSELDARLRRIEEWLTSIEDRLSILTDNPAERRKLIDQLTVMLLTMKEPT